MTTVKRRQIALLIGDLALMFVALGMTLLVRYSDSEFSLQLKQHLFPMSIIFALWLIVLYANGLYDLYFIKPSLQFYRRFTESWAAALGVAVALFYLVPLFNITPKTNLFILSAVYAALFALWRAAAGAAFHTQIRTLLIEPGKEFLELIQSLRKNKQLGYEVVGIISDEQPPAGTDLPHFPTKTPLRALTSEHRVNLIIVGPTNTSSELDRELYELLFWDVYVMPSNTFFESLTGRIAIDTINEKWFLENMRAERPMIYHFIHQLIDYVFALFGSLFVALLIPFVAFAQKINFPGPLFYKQERVGRNGKRFWVYKFRTMKALSKDGSAELNGAQTAGKNDPRVTAIGAFMRRTRLDEWPQILNILFGDMSLIGPRPERPEFVYELERRMPFYAVRHLVKPGITGWAQINFPYVENLEDQIRKFQYDLYYIKNRSAFLDLTIILKTAHVVLYGKGQ